MVANRVCCCLGKSSVERCCRWRRGRGEGVVDGNDGGGATGCTRRKLRLGGVSSRRERQRGFGIGSLMDYIMRRGLVDYPVEELGGRKCRVSPSSMLSCQNLGVARANYNIVDEWCAVGRRYRSRQVVTSDASRSRKHRPRTPWRPAMPAQSSPTAHQAPETPSTRGQRGSPLSSLNKLLWLQLAVSWPLLDPLMEMAW